MLIRLTYGNSDHDLCRHLHFTLNLQCTVEGFESSDKSTTVPSLTIEENTAEETGVIELEDFFASTLTYKAVSTSWSSYLASQPPTPYGGENVSTLVIKPVVLTALGRPACKARKIG